MHRQAERPGHSFLARAALALLAVFVAIAAVSALAGALFAYFRGGVAYAHAIGWAMWIVGGLLSLVMGQSGSPSRMSVEGRWGFFGQYWGGNPALPESPIWLVFVSMLVLALGVPIYVIG